MFARSATSSANKLSYCIDQERKELKGAIFSAKILLSQTQPQESEDLSSLLDKIQNTVKETFSKETFLQNILDSDMAKMSSYFVKKLTREEISKINHLISKTEKLFPGESKDKISMIALLQGGWHFGKQQLEITFTQLNFSKQEYHNSYRNVQHKIQNITGTAVESDPEKQLLSLIENLEKVSENIVEGKSEMDKGGSTPLSDSSINL